MTVGSIECDVFGAGGSYAAGDIGAADFGRGVGDSVGRTVSDEFAGGVETFEGVRERGVDCAE